MDTARETLEARISLLLGWEKRKRREATLTVALFYAFLAALAVPLFVSLSPGWAWAAPAAIFAVLTPCLLFTRRWRDRDTARALAALDRTLRLDERATTAWELLRRNETKAVALLVLRQASDMLEELRRAGALSALVEAGTPGCCRRCSRCGSRCSISTRGSSFRAQRRGIRLRLHEKLREFARELQQKAQSERLPKTLEAARELEKIAQRGIDAGTADEAVQKRAGRRGQEDGGGKERLPGRRRSAQLKAGASSTISGRSSKRRANRSTPGDGEAQSWQERLAGLSQLKKQLDRQQGGARELTRGELKALPRQAGAGRCR